MQLYRGVSLSSAFCLWHGHCAVADWLKDTLIRSLGIWHVFSKEGSPFAGEQKKKTLPPPSLITLLALVPHAPDSEQKDGLRDDLCHRLLTCWGLMAATRKLQHHLTLFLCLIPPPQKTSSTALHLPKYHLSLSLTLVHHCTVAFNFQRWTLCWIHEPEALHQRQWQIVL